MIRKLKRVGGNKKYRLRGLESSLYFYLIMRIIINIWRCRKMSIEIKGNAIKKNLTLYKPDIDRLEWLMAKYKEDASGLIRKLIKEKYNQDNNEKAYRYAHGKCVVCGKEDDLYKGIHPNQSLQLEERILENMCKYCISEKILNIK
jgi:hypothetical protein